MEKTTTPQTPTAAEKPADATFGMSTMKDFAGELDLSTSRLKAVLDLMNRQLYNPAANDMTPFVLLDAAQRYAAEIEQIMAGMYAAAGMKRAENKNG
jgi:hypothetical protein